MLAGGVRLAFGTLFTESKGRSASDSVKPSASESKGRSASDSVKPSASESKEPIAAKPLEPWEYAGSDDTAGAERAALDQLRIYDELRARARVEFVLTASSLREVRESREGHDDREGRNAREELEPRSPAEPLKLLILMEGADPIVQPSHLQRWVDRGVRAIGLSWARGSRYAGGNARPGSLTDLGRALLDEMSALGVILDVSHLADLALDEALDRFDGAVMASHSNARALLEPSERHLRDDHAQRIAERGGVIGLNLFGKFLASGRSATIDDAIGHLEHWRALVGVEHIGIGSDFDGGFTPLECPPGVGRPEQLPHLLEALRAAGWQDDEIRAVAGGSWLDFLRRSLPA